jgi:putative tricarboxylic transport membrane protein
MCPADVIARGDAAQPSPSKGESGVEKGPVSSACSANPEGMSMIADRVIFVLILVLAGVYFWATQQIPSLEIGDPLGPKAFPRLLGIGLLVTAAMLAGEMWKARKEPRAPAPAGLKTEAVVVGAVAVWTWLYFLVFEPLGFMIATTLYLLGLTNFFNRGKWITNVVTSILFPVCAYFLFTKALGVSLARGFLPF